MEIHLPVNFKWNKCQAMCINTNVLLKHNTNHHPDPKTKSNRVRRKTTSIQKCKQYGDKCLGCPIPDCKRCVNCRDKATNEGQNILRQRCKDGWCREGPTNGWGPEGSDLNPVDRKQEHSDKSEGGPDKSDNNPDAPEPKNSNKIKPRSTQGPRPTPSLPPNPRPQTKPRPTTTKGIRQSQIH